MAPVQHDVANRIEVTDLSGHADQELLAVAFDVAGADVLVIGRERLHDVVQGEPQRDHLRRIGCDVDLPLEATDGVDLSYTRHVAELRADYPILEGAQVGGRVGRAVLLARLGVGVDGIHEDLAHASGNGAHLRFQSFG